MSQSQPSQRPSLDSVISSQLQQELSYVRDTWPQALASLESTAPGLSPAVSVDAKLATAIQQVSTQEKDELFEQLRSISVLPPTKLDPTTGQLLQEPLSLLLATPVSFSNQHTTIPLHTGVAAGLGHGPNLPSALTSPQLSSAGQQLDLRTWELRNTPKAANVPLDDLYKWSVVLSAAFLAVDGVDNLQATATPPSWLLQPVILINPVSQRAATAWITGLLTHQLHRYQWGASPALSRWLQLWSGSNEGRVVVVPVTNSAVTPHCWDLKSSSASTL